MTVFAVAPDLMDRGRIDAARPAKDVVHVRFDAAVEQATAGDVVLVDLGRAPADIAPLVVTGARIVGFAAHVDDATLAEAAGLGVEALPRSVFFRRVGDF
jgi:hypothetical protein